MEIIVSLSALPPSLYRKYVKGWKPNPTLLGLFEKLSGKKGTKAMRLYIDAKTDTVIKNITQSIKAPKPVEDALRSRDIQIVDYVAGAGKDKHGRVVKIGRILAKDPELKKMFDSDPNRKAMTNATRNHQLICISMHPYDIAGMSTDRGWVSCMDLKTGENKKYVKQDVEGGTLIAYLIDPQDKNINKPIGRCLAKPYFQKSKAKAAERFIGSETVNALYLVEIAYPDAKMPFVHVLQEWLDEHINPFIASTERKGVYTLASKLYADQRSTEFNYDVEAPMLRGDVIGFVKGLVSRPRTPSLEGMVEDYLERFPDIAVMLAKYRWGNSRFFVRCASVLLGTGHYDKFQEFVEVIFDKFDADDSVISQMWEDISGKPRAMHIFIDNMPVDMRKKFLEASLDEADLYSSHDNVRQGGAFPAALSQIWSFAKMSVNPDSMFWYHASRINTAGILTRYVDEEYMGSNNQYGGSNNQYDEYVLSPSIGSLANMSPPVAAANRATLERYKAIVNPRYYEAAQKVFAGYKYVHIEYKELRNKLRTVFEQHDKIKSSEVSLAMHRTDVDLAVGQAIEEMHSASDILAAPYALLVDSDDNPQDIAQAILDRALDIAVEQAVEEVANYREEQARLKARRAAKK